MPFALPSDIPLSLLAIMVVTVATGYTMFGATGFGSSIISVPILAHWLPLPFLIPLVTATDGAAATMASFRQWRLVCWREVRILLLPILIGIALGLTLLIRLPRDTALGALGIFVGSYAIYTLSGARAWRSISALWAIPLGIAGGGFSALFGTGGPIYMIYLSSRIEEKTALRATSSLLVAISVDIRMVAFIFTGLYLQDGLLLLIALLLPVMIGGYALGSRLHRRLSGAAVRRAIALLLLGNAVLLVLRAVQALN